MDIYTLSTVEMTGKLRKGEAHVDPSSGQVLDSRLRGIAYTAPLPTLTAEQRALAYALRTARSDAKQARDYGHPELAKFIEGQATGLEQAASILWWQRKPLVYQAVMYLAAEGDYWGEI